MYSSYNICELELVGVARLVKRFVQAIGQFKRLDWIIYKVLYIITTTHMTLCETINIYFLLVLFAQQKHVECFRRGASFILEITIFTQNTCVDYFLWTTFCKRAMIFWLGLKVELPGCFFKGVT